jgi:hypothetical protein
MSLSRRSQNQRPEFRPSDVHELKLKTQQAVLKTRQLRTQLNRLNDRITSHTNAIIKTRNQQSETPAVATNHANSVPQLKRSIDSAEHALEVLKEEIVKAKQDDKTFVVKELEEEVKLAYCENVRLAARLKDSRSKTDQTERSLQNAMYKVHPTTYQQLHDTVRRLQVDNASLRDKAIAYDSKRRKLEIERIIKEHQDAQVPAQATVDQAAAQQKEQTAKLAEQVEALANEKREFTDKVTELTRIIDEQRRKISEKLCARKTDGAGDAEAAGREPNCCIDGRAHGLIFGSPGGDAGIVLRVLLAANAVLGIDPSVDRIRSLITAFSRVAKRRLYFHTDGHATHHYDPRVRFDAQKCVEAAHIGCGYFKASIHMPDKIGPSDTASLSAVAAKVWTAFCALCAGKSAAVQCVELEGDHAENDVLVVEKFEKADPDGHCFVYHPVHEDLVAGQLVDVICQEYDMNRPGDVKSKLTQICEEHWKGAIELLAPGVEHRYLRPDGAVPDEDDPVHECSSCIDGRAHGLLYGSPGGDAGIVLRVLVAAKAILGVDPSIDRIKALITKYGGSAKRALYFHTDTHATHHYDPRTKFDAQKCCQAAHIGCGYFKGSIHMPEKIGPSDTASLSALGQKVWSAFCALAAGKSSAVQCVELEGEHAENDVVVVEKFEKADPDGHCFVYHPGHEEAIGGQLVDLICQEYDVNRQDEVKAQFKEVCKEHWDGAITLLAPGVEHRHIT